MTINNKRTPAKTKDIPPSTKPQEAFQIANLADVLEHITKTDLPEHAHRDVRWAINSLCAALGVAPVDVSADIRILREQLDTLSPAMLGLKPASLSNIRSILRRVIRAMGKPVRRRTRGEPLSAIWTPLYDSLTSRNAKGGMGAFISYCDAEGHSPTDVSDQLLARFAEMLKETSLSASWRKCVDSTVREWNRAVREVAGWPSTELHTPWGQREVFTLPMADLPFAYQGSVEEYLDYLANPPAHDDFAPLHGLRPESIISKRFALRQMASVLLRAGTQPENLTSVDDLVAPAAIDTILKHFEPAPDGTGRVNCHLMALHLQSIARSQKTPPPAAVLHRLAHTIWRHRRKTVGLTKNNREKVTRLKDDRTAARLLMLPPRIYDTLGKKQKPTERDANIALTALYIELSLMWPARIGNLSKIHLTENIARAGAGRTARVFLHFDAAVVKNNKNLEAELPPETAHMLDLFIARYRPLLLKTPSMYLFPHRNGGPRHRGTIWGSMTKLTLKHVGVSINPHLLRHIGGLFFLKAQPGNYEVLRRTLGHSSIDTTTRFYAGAEDDAAIRMFDNNVLRLREAAPELLRGRSRRRPAAAVRRATKSTVIAAKRAVKK